MSDLLIKGLSEASLRPSSATWKSDVLNPRGRSRGFVSLVQVTTCGNCGEVSHGGGCRNTKTWGWLCPDCDEVLNNPK